ncbi:phosphate-starvation-inducible PsiE family protein [Arenimonas fontis]|uniref:Phosphate-starvation-inducible PsiE family protein n=1 Tax=Arenimonas fontis TaxID=2608255 RepID=A0A5B2ZBU5_9GAMM|nr:phosphate-starvation-inducible PsiE family protein [Arenimonas fontis]KAA2285013.1 phosphate-starvation-inducible PsiE family protein [Arenimonas fontis]
MQNPLIQRLEKLVSIFLTAILVAYILVEMVELAYQFGKAVISTEGEEGRLLITKEQTREVLPVFFSILIATELINTLNFYVREHLILIRSILLIGLMAIGRKLLTVDLVHLEGATVLGIAALILALATGHYLMGRSSGSGIGPSASSGDRAGGRDRPSS